MNIDTLLTPEEYDDAVNRARAFIHSREPDVVGED
jgi:hypothetical protein